MRLRELFHHPRVRWIHKEPLVLIAVLLAAGAAWAFVELADDVSEGETATIDERLLLLLRNPADRTDPLGPETVEDFMRDISAIGGNGIQALLILGVCGYLWLQRRRKLVGVIVVAILGGLVISTSLKQGFQRPRPDLVPHEAYTVTTSFPSQHTMMSAVTYLTLGALLASVHKGRRIRAYIMACAVLLTVAVGFSRVYLGVHWPTDVLAGWAGGATWALLWLAITRWLQVRGTVEDEETPTPADEDAVAA